LIKIEVIPINLNNFDEDSKLIFFYAVKREVRKVNIQFKCQFVLTKYMINGIGDYDIFGFGDKRQLSLDQGKLSKHFIIPRSTCINWNQNTSIDF